MTADNDKDDDVVTALAAVLTAGGRRSAKSLAARLLTHFGSLRQVLDATDTQLLQHDGLGPGRLSAVRAIPRVAQQFFSESLPKGHSINTPTDTSMFLQARMRHLNHELFCCLYLDNRHRVLRFDELFRGTIDGTSVYPREVVKEALAVNAAALILAHNHPSGVAEPSQADERITRRLKSALELVDIRLLDHLIVGDGATTSLAQRGLI